MLLTVGRVIRPHGVRGEVVVEVVTDEPDQRYATGVTLSTAPPERPGPASGGPGRAPIPATLTIGSARWHQGRMLVAFEGIDDRAGAEALRGVLLRIDSAAVPSPTDPEEFHDHQLIGLAAVDPVGQPLGTVTGVEHAPAADLLLLSGPDGRVARVPFVTAIVPTVDPAGGRIVIDPPPGLLEL